MTYQPTYSAAAAHIERVRHLTVKQVVALGLSPATDKDRLAWYTAANRAADVAKLAELVVFPDPCTPAVTGIAAAWEASWNACPSTRDKLAATIAHAFDAAAWHSTAPDAFNLPSNICAAISAHAWEASWCAALALLVRDRITCDEFDVLYGPWASVIEGEKPKKSKYQMTVHPYGPNHAEVDAHLERVRHLTPEQVQELAIAYSDADSDAARSAAEYAAFDAAWTAATYALGVAAFDAARHAAMLVNPSLPGADDASLNAFLALLVRDLITTEQFNLLHGPWASVMERPA